MSRRPRPAPIDLEIVCPVCGRLSVRPAVNAATARHLEERHRQAEPEHTPEIRPVTR